MNKTKPEEINKIKSKAWAEFKRQLRNAIKNPDMKRFSEIVYHCPEPLSCKDDSLDRLCYGCLIYNNERCLLTPMMRICRAYHCKKIDEKTALARLVFNSTKLLAYLESREEHGI